MLIDQFYKTAIAKLIIIPKSDKDFENLFNGKDATSCAWKEAGNAELKNFTFYEPEDFAERVKIGNCFTYFDSIITFHQQKCDELKNIKRFMLQNIFVSEK